MGRKQIQLIGRKFGKLTVVSVVSKDNNGNRKYLCQCDCGQIKQVCSSHLLNKNRGTKSCGCLRSKFQDITNKKYGKLFVVKFIRFKSKNKCSMWECLCDCGKTIIVYGSNLRRNNSTCCGCSKLKDVKYKLPGFQNRSYVLQSYKRHCKELNREWSLTNTQAFNLFQSNCYYCGIQPSQTRTTSKKGFPYIYNGIDRVDNNLGYTTENCVACCKYCNYAKHNRTVNDFIIWAKHLFANLSKIGLAV